MGEMGKEAKMLRYRFLFLFSEEISVSSLNTATESGKKNLAEAIQMWECYSRFQVHGRAW